MGAVRRTRNGPHTNKAWLVDQYVTKDKSIREIAAMCGVKRNAVLVVEIFGDYWHRGENPEELIGLYKQAGIDCLVFWEHEIYKSPEDVRLKTQSFAAQGE